MRKILAMVLIAVLVFSASSLVTSHSVKADPLPAPAISGVEPASPWQSDDREGFSILGSGFVKNPKSIVTVKAPDPDNRTWEIPRENNTFSEVNEDGTRIDVNVQFHMEGTWTVWVTNPDGEKSEPAFPFEVKGKKPTARIPADLLDKIDDLIEENPASQFYNASWGISKDQYKLMIAALAWAEVESAGYQAHSSDAADVWHQDLPVDSSGFHFSTGLGPYQITLGGTEYLGSKGVKPDLGVGWSNWKTIEKLNSTYALRSVLYRHKYRAASVTTLEDLRVAMGDSDWYGYRYPTYGNWRTRWEQMTGTKWDVVNNSSKSTDLLLGHPGLGWNRIKAQLIQNENDNRWVQEKDVVKGLGFQKWAIPEEEGITNRAGQPVIIDECLPTWSISAWKSMKTELRYTYYYTYHEDLGLEIWALARDPKYIFTRTYTTPTGAPHRPDNNGLKLTNSPVTIVDPGPGLAAKAVANVANILGAPYHGDAKGRHWAPSGEHSAGGARWATPEEVRHIGYRWGSGRPIQKGIDSSGLIMWAYNLAYRPQGGYLSGDNPVYRIDADKQWADKTRMTQRRTFQGATAISDFLQEYEADPSSLGLLPGDPIYFLDPRSGIGNDHVAMYVGNGCIAHALPGSQGKVVHEKLTDILARYGEGGDWFRLVGLGRVVVREIDVVLVIDDSGSMRSNDPAYMRRQAAEVFINAMQDSDQIGIVAFTSTVSLLRNIQPVGEDRQPIIESLKALGSSGGTNLSRALLKAYEQLQSVESSGNRKAVVFLTDGYGTYNNEAQMFGKKDWPIYVLGLGNQINERQLQDIADDSGGAYRHLNDPDQMSAIYHEIAVAIAGGEMLLEVIQEMTQGSTVERIFQIVVETWQAIIAVFWGNSSVDTILIAPDGTVIDPSTVNPNVYHAKGLTYEMYRLANPLLGQWTVIMYGSDLPSEGRNVTLQVSVVGQAEDPGHELIMAADPVKGGTATDLTGESSYGEGAVVSIRAQAAEGYRFAGWTATAGEFADASAETTTFVMPGQAVSVTARFTLKDILPVGGTGYLVNRLAILAPWLTLFAAIAAGASLLVLRRRQTQS